jgi:hypothetical protein
LKIHFNIITPSTPRSSMWSHSLRSPYQNPACTIPVSHTCHMPCSSAISILQDVKAFSLEVQANGGRTPYSPTGVLSPSQTMYCLL